MGMSRMQSIALLVALLVAIGLSSTDASIFRQGHGRHRPLAAIFGFGRKNDEDEGNHSGRESQSSALPTQYTPQIPGPPAPSSRQQLHMQQWQQKRVPPPPPASSNGKSSPEANSAQEDPSGEGLPPQPPQNEWNQGADSSWQGMEDPSGQNNNAVDPFQMLQMDLEAAIRREQDLLAQLHNMTSAMMGMEQREELHLRQLDVLTERVMDVEALAAEEHNQLLEYQANCSLMDMEIAKLNGEVEDWKERCLEADEVNKKKSAEYSKLLKQLERAKRESEQLATRVEQHRLDEIRATYNQRKKASRPFGLLGWMLGMHKRDDDELEDLREAAKSTLIHALQDERNNVEELEAAVNALEQNNSVIALQIQSRDELIDELNERVAVFEEDKVVLKAALQQLRKDMLEEAPKTQKLIEDLSEAHDEIERLQAEVASMIDKHTQQVSSLESFISDKENQIAETQANVTMIGEYVNKLEERLADFAVARRDIDRREQKCIEMEKESQRIDEECTSLREKIASGEKEQEQLKTLMQEMVSDRSSLQDRIDQLTAEKEQAGNEIGRLMSSADSLRGEVEGLRQQLEQNQRQLGQSQRHIQQQSQQLQQQQQVLQQQGAFPGQDIPARFHEYENQVAGLLQENEQMKQDFSNDQKVISDLRHELDSMTASRQELENLLREAQTTTQDLEGKLAEAIVVQESAQEKLREETLRHKEHLAEAKAKAESLLKEQSATLEASLSKDISNLETLLSQARNETENALKQEREKYEGKLKEQTEDSEAKLSQVKGEVEALLKTEYERYEKKLAEEKERVAKMLQDGEEKTATQLRLELETEKSKYEELLSQEKDRSSRKVKETEQQLDSKVQEAVAAEKEKMDRLLKEEQERVNQKLQDEQKVLEEEFKARLVEENDKFESKLQAVRERLVVDLEAKESRIEELSRALASSEESTSKIRVVQQREKTDPSSANQKQASETATASKVRELETPAQEKQNLTSGVNMTASNSTKGAQKLATKGGATIARNSTTDNDRIGGNLTKSLPRRRPPPRPNMPQKKKSASRSLRKFFAQSTGLHGFFSKKYAKRPARKLPPRPRSLPSGNSTFATRSNATAIPRQGPPSARKAPPGRRLPAQNPKGSPVFAVRPKGQTVKLAPNKPPSPKLNQSHPSDRSPPKRGQDPPAKVPPSMATKSTNDKSQQ